MKLDLVIVESPKKAKTIKKILGNKFYVIASYGHIWNLPKKEFGIYIKNNKLKYKYQIINWSFIKKLKSILDKYENIYLATDPDREGEFIAWSISKYLENKSFYRIRFNEITKNALINSLNNKDKINNNLVSAQKSRRFLDRIVGYTISPILWKKKIGKSAGRVQSAALRLIVEREEEIRNFKPEIYYWLEVNFSNFKAYLINNKDSINFNKEYKLFLEKIKEKLKSQKFILKEIIINKKTISKPTPIDTALLQRISFLKHRFSASLTMFLAQSLYEKGLITYHRTDSFNLSQDFLFAIKKFLKDDYQDPIKTKKSFSQEAHEAIRPVYLKKDLKLNYKEKLLYELIFNYTLSSCSQNAVVEKIKYIIKPQKFSDLIFEAQGERLIKVGFLKYYPFQLSFKHLPELKEGEVLIPEDINLVENKTQPPHRYTEASLIKKLKNLGIGRPSTYAEIVKTLFKRKYIEKYKNSLKPTSIGEMVVKFLIKNYPKIIDLKFTSEMENSLDKIAQGKLDYENYIINFWKELKNSL
ncbi:MAG: DNA topoisomerase 1 [Candidatus Parcubacteria bacterium]|nr:MAG: DNA topoisomerase 1 [Candidatus Parcubacteria bacterium]